MTAHQGHCLDCDNKRSVPLAPTVGMTVVVYDELSGFYKKEIAAGQINLGDAVLMPRPLIVTDANVLRRGSEVGLYVEVSGWRLLRSQRLPKPEHSGNPLWVDGLGWVIPCRIAPAMAWIEGIKGPRDEPGCWTWVKEPS